MEFSVAGQKRGCALIRNAPADAYNIVERANMDSTMPSALTSTVERFEQPLMRYALRFVSDRERARDVVQDTFLRLCESDVDEADPRLGAWLFTVCRNRAIDVKRRRSKLAVMSEQPEVAVEARADERRAVAEVFEVIDTMAERPARVMQMRYREGHSYERIAEATGMSVSHVGVTIHKAVRRLRTQLAVAVVVLLVAGVVWQQLTGRQVAVLESMDVPTAEDLQPPAAVDLESEWPAAPTKRLPKRVVIVPEPPARVPAYSGRPAGDQGGGSGGGGLAAPRRAVRPAELNSL